MTGPSPARTPDERFAVVYQCPDCQQRLLDEQRRTDWPLICRRIDLGGHCLLSYEPVAIKTSPPTRSMALVH